MKIGILPLIIFIGCSSSNWERVSAQKESNIIDVVAINKETNDVILIIKEFREWGVKGELLPEFQEKINAYLIYALDGKMEQDNPRSKGNRFYQFGKRESIGAKKYWMGTGKNRIDERMNRVRPFPSPSFTAQAVVIWTEFHKQPKFRRTIRRRYPMMGCSVTK